MSYNPFPSKHSEDWDWENYFPLSQNYFWLITQLSTISLLQRWLQASSIAFTLTSLFPLYENGIWDAVKELVYSTVLRWKQPVWCIVLNVNINAGKKAIIQNSVLAQGFWNQTIDCFFHHSTRDTVVTVLSSKLETQNSTSKAMHSDSITRRSTSISTVHSSFTASDTSPLWSNLDPPWITMKIHIVAAVTCLVGYSIWCLTQTTWTVFLS